MPVSRGSYGTCYRATFGGIEVAVKEILKYRESPSEEAEIISSLRNPHLPVLIGFAKSEEWAFQVTKFHSYCVELVTLDAGVERKLLSKALNPNWLTLLGGVFQALSFLHEDVGHGVGHGLSQLKVPSTSTRFHGCLSNISIHFNNNMLIPEGFHEIVIPDHPADLGCWLQTNGIQEDIIGIICGEYIHKFWRQFTARHYRCNNIAKSNIDNHWQPKTDSLFLQCLKSRGFCKSKNRFCAKV